MISTVDNRREAMRSRRTPSGRQARSMVTARCSVRGHLDASAGACGRNLSRSKGPDKIHWRYPSWAAPTINCHQTPEVELRSDIMGSITANQSPRDNAVVFSLKRGNSKTLRLSANDSPTWAAAVPGGCWAPSTLNPDDKLPAPTGIPMSPWIPGGLNCDPHGVCPNPKTFFTLAVGGFPKTEVVWGNPGGVEILGCCIPSSCLLPPWGVPYEPLPPADALRRAISCWIWFSTFFNAWACRASSSKRSRWVNPSGNTTEARAPSPGPAPCWCGNPPARWAASEGWAVSDGWAGWPAPFWPVWTPPSTSRLTFSLQNALISGGRGGVIKTRIL